MWSAIIIALCGVSIVAAEVPFANPVFYTNKECTVVDPKAALWSYAAKDKVAVKPFAKPGVWLSGHTIDECLTDSSVSYSVMLKIDDAACPAKGDEALQLSYWKNSKTCEGAAVVTPLKADVCVPTSLGFAKFAPSLTAEELCTVTNYFTAMKTGGVRTRGWTGGKCAAKLPLVTRLTTLGVKDCGAQPECIGCCQAFDDETCKPNRDPSYLETLRACNKVANGWEGALVTNGYNDAKCTSQNNKDPASRLKLRIGTCSTVKASGNELSVIVDFVAPLTMDLYCQYVQLSANKSINGYLTWEAFNKRVNAAPAAHPVSALALATLLVAVVLF